MNPKKAREKYFQELRCKHWSDVDVFVVEVLKALEEEQQTVKELQNEILYDHGDIKEYD